VAVTIDNMITIKPSKRVRHAAEPARQLSLDLSVAFKALGSPSRLAIISALLKQELTCCEGDRSADCTLDAAACNVGSLAESLKIDSGTLSHHLKELDYAGLIERSRRGRQIFCRVNRVRLEQMRRYLLPEKVETLTRARRPRASVTHSP
jgi:DNA-binding transcriptional ArsR family regulator